MKRLSSIFIALVLAIVCFVLLPMDAQAASSEYYTYRVLPSGEATITDCDTSISGEITIPSTLGGYPVTSIGYSAFEDCTGLTSVTIPGSVTSIESYAFFSCYDLTSVTILGGVTTIGDYAFGEGYGLTSITLPNTLTSIGEFAFFDCSLTSIIIPDSVTEIGSGAFEYCDNLMEIVIPDGVTVVSSSVFSGCTKLTSISIPSTVTTIGMEAFEGCNSLSKVVYCGTQDQWDAISFGDINEPLIAALQFHEYENGVCIYCGLGVDWEYTITDSKVTINGYKGSETDLVIPDTIEGLPVISIDSWAFSVCTNLTEIIIPDSIVSIGYCAFNNCKNLASVTIGSGVTSIGGRAFRGCASLTDITIPGNVTSIGDLPFEDCSNLTAIRVAENNPNYISDSSGVLFNKDKTALIQAPCAIDGEYAIPSSVVSVGDGAFSACTGLTSITIPDSVTSIGDGAFSDCSSLEGIWVHEANSNYSSDSSGVLLNKDKTVLIRTPSRILGKYTIPSSVTSLNKSSFSGCAGLTEIIIPESVTSIGEYAFFECTGLTEVAIPESVTSIGTSAFYRCTGLTEMVIPSSTTSIGSGTFFLCSNLVSVTIPDGMSTIGGGMFYGCYKLTSITIPNSVTSIGTQAFYGCTSLTSITIPDSVTSIGSQAFSDCTSLTSITIPDSVTSIGQSVFFRCTRLEKAVYCGTQEQWDAISIGLSNEPLTAVLQFHECENGVCIHCGLGVDWEYTISGGEVVITRYIGNDADLAIPKTIENLPVITIGEGTFQECHSLKSIVIPNGVRLSGNYVFRNCSNLTTVTISDNSISTAAFTGCNIETLIISGDVTTVTSRHVISSKTLKNVIISNGVTGIDANVFYYSSNLLSVTIPASVTSIGNDAFSSCRKLQGIWVDENNSNYSSDEQGVLYNKDKTLLIRAPGGIAGTVDIPSTVVEIGNSAFELCGSMTGVIIPNSVKSIGDDAFHWCSSLLNVTIPESVISIGERAFNQCNALENAYVSGSVTAIGDYAFSDCINLQGIWVSESNLNYCSDSLGVLFDKNKTVLIQAPGKLSGHYVVPDSVTRIGDWAFMQQEGENPPISGVTLPEGLNSIGKFAFAFCVNLSDINIPSSVTLIDTGAFQGCAGLKEIGLPSGEVSIGSMAFQGCGLTSVEIPEGVTSLKDSSFGYCTDLSRIVLPSSLTDVEDYALAGCNTLATVICCGTQEHWDAVNIGMGNEPLTNAQVQFHDCENGVCIYCGLGVDWEYSITNGEVTINGYAGTETDLVIPDTIENLPVTSIGYEAFSGCTSLTSITIPDSVVYIEAFAFHGCYGLTRITIGNGVTAIDHAFAGCTGLEGVYISDLKAWCKTSFADANSNPLLYAGKLYLNNTLITNLIIPDGVTFVEHWGFVGLTSLTSITIPDSVTGIGWYAFSGCTGLTKINIPDGVARIGWCAFSDCADLTTVMMPDSVTVIEEQAFEGCSNLKTVFYSGTKAERDSIDRIDENACLTSATWHYKATEFVFAGQDCYYCDECDTCFLPNGEHALATVIFQNWDGTELSSQSVCYNGTVAIPPAPQRQHAQANVYQYVFDGWDNEVVKCAGNATYTATYKEIYIDYTVVFKNWNGDVLSTKTYHWGDEVAAPANPTKAADETYTYPFAGWDKEVVACAGDATYTATYTPKYIDYTVVFKNWNGDELSTKTYHWGEAVTLPADPTRAADNTYTYAFKDWGAEVVNCAGDATYTATYTPKYIDYTVVFKNWDGTVLSTETYHWGEEIVLPANPTKAADNTYTYAFKGWDDEVVNCAGDATYTATYTPKYIDYTVTFVDEDGTEISKNTYHWDEEIVVPADPTKAVDNTYTYSFAGWDKPVVDCAGNATYTATYTSKYIDYTVEFKDWNGYTISTKTYHWGDVITIPANPSRGSDTTYTYAFGGWDKEVATACNGNVTYTATYEKTYIPYMVIFKDWNGNFLAADTYHYGDKVAPPSDPAKAADNTYTYSFAGWDKPVVDCAGNATYTATYTSKYIDYTVEFKDWNGTVLSTKSYHWGDAITVPANPSRPDEGLNVYTFAGWDKGVVDCAGNATYTATYSVTQKPTGWVLDGETWYYYDQSGEKVTGWLLDGDTWYYMESGGAMQTGWLNLGGTWYYLAEGGAMQTGWLNLGGTWYYLAEGGAMQTGWVNVAGTWYYMEPGGVMQTGWLNLGGVWYYLAEGGAMQTGWVNVAGTWYYMEPGGAMQTGWLNLGGTWYYLADGGAMQTGWVNVAGTWYYMEPGGAVQTGWLLLGDTWYYLKDGGAMQTGWLLDGGTWYYFNAGGAMVTGWQLIGGTWYNFSSSGVWIG